MGGMVAAIKSGEATSSGDDGLLSIREEEEDGGASYCG